ncbi:MAG: hypothetical protein UV34_C0032G0002 [Parcubacteria group bacterium GW2011_GWB1_42_6]|nr:MAG: hypothetical protein UV34_C0032G0002 [Parcubacteria group bacterium GW2011_GWB1_42_6]
MDGDSKTGVWVAFTKVRGGRILSAATHPLDAKNFSGIENPVIFFRSLGLASRLTGSGREKIRADFCDIVD